MRHAKELSEREARQASIWHTYSSVFFLFERPWVRARNAFTAPSSTRLIGEGARGGGYCVGEEVRRGRGAEGKCGEEGVSNWLRGSMRGRG